MAKYSILNELTRRERRSALSNLKKARRLLARPDGWMKGNFTDGRRYCTWGAVRKASGQGKRVATELLTELLPETFSCLAAFNDAQKTVKPVLRPFDRAIAKVEKYIEKHRRAA